MSLAVPFHFLLWQVKISVPIKARRLTHCIDSSLWFLLWHRRWREKCNSTHMNSTYTRGQYITFSIKNHKQLCLRAKSVATNINRKKHSEFWRTLTSTHLQCWLSQLRWMGLCPVCFVPTHWTGTLSQAPVLAPPTRSEHQKLALNASHGARSRLFLTWEQK